MNVLSKNSVTWESIDDSSENQRIDNFLIKRLKGVPRNHVYRLLRSGEVRVNSKRVDATYRLQNGDRVRIPPVRIAEGSVTGKSAPAGLVRHKIYEDDYILAIAKPSGVAVHGGSGISRGVVEQLRADHPDMRFLELVHRLDRETSGVLLLAKKRTALIDLHRQIREGLVEKYYLVLVSGKWRDAKRSVRLALDKRVTPSGERRVSVREDGQEAHTVFRLLTRWDRFSLLEAELKTGRTHQIRVHLSHLGFPIAGDDKYGDFVLNRELTKLGLKRMFLHAHRIGIVHPATGVKLQLEAPLSPELQDFINYLNELRTPATNL